MIGFRDGLSKWPIFNLKLAEINSSGVRQKKSNG